MNEIKEQKIETLKTAEEYIGRLERGILECEEHFQASREDKGYEIVTQIIDGIGWLIEAVSLTNDLHNEHIEIEEIKESLEGLMEGLENKDIVLIIDVLKYEILEVIKIWREKIQEVTNYKEYE